MLNATCDLTLPTTVTGSGPRPSWVTEMLRGRPFKEALGDSRFDLAVGGKPWSFKPIERLLGITGDVDRVVNRRRSGVGRMRSWALTPE